MSMRTMWITLFACEEQHVARALHEAHVPGSTPRVIVVRGWKNPATGEEKDARGLLHNWTDGSVAVDTSVDDHCGDIEQAHPIRPPVWSRCPPSRRTLEVRNPATGRIERRERLEYDVTPLLEHATRTASCELLRLAACWEHSLQPFVRCAPHAVLPHAFPSLGELLDLRDDRRPPHQHDHFGERLDRVPADVVAEVLGWSDDAIESIASTLDAHTTDAVWWLTTLQDVARGAEPSDGLFALRSEVDDHFELNWEKESEAH